jgi:cytochrome c oxidase assembly protein subunit 11
MTGNNKTILVLASIVGLMIGVAYASVPLYSLFCKATGFGGTTRVAASPKTPAVQTNERRITISFDGNVDPALPWEFTPETKTVSVKVGEPVLVKYHAVNHGLESAVGTATYNVQPDKAGAYFYKTQCFCFTKQILNPGEATEMAVEFYIDSSIADDRRMDDVQNITLSYTFFRAKDQSKAHTLKQAYLPISNTHPNP